MRRNVDLSTIFIEVYRAYPATYLDRVDLECTNSIILPSSALQKFTSMRDGFGNKSNPVLFRILNISLNIYTHCGVLDFTAQDDICYLPTNMFYRLCLNPGDKVNLRNIKLDKGKYIKIQPHLTEFINCPNPKTILENALRAYFCLTKGDTIRIEFNKKYYDLDIVDCKPKTAILILNQDIEVDFEKPLDYDETQEKVQKKQNVSSNPFINFNSEKKKNKEDNSKEMEDSKFYGHHGRLDGKNFTANQIKKVMEQKKKIDLEESFNPREHRIYNKNRIHFHYVGNFDEFVPNNFGY